MSTWTLFQSGGWEDSFNWTGAVPNGVDAIADFLALNPNAPDYANVDLANMPSLTATLGTLNLQSSAAGAYSFTGGTLNMATSGGSAQINVGYSGAGVALAMTLETLMTLNLGVSTTITVTEASLYFNAQAQVTGSGSLTKDGDGVLTLGNGSNDWGGGIFILAGAVLATGNDSLSHGSCFIGLSGTLDLFASVQSIGALSGNGVVTNSGSSLAILRTAYVADSGFQGSITDGAMGAVALIKEGTAKLTLSGGNNSYSGGTTVLGGTLAAGATNAIGPHGDVLIFAGATLDLGGFSQSIKGLFGEGVITNTGGVLAILTTNTAADFEYAGNILGGVGGLGLTKTGAGTLTLTGANTYTGNTFISGGALALSGNGSIGISASLLPLLTISAGGTFDISGLSAASTIISDLSLQGGQIVLGGKTLIVANGGAPGSGNIAGSAGVDGFVYTADTGVSGLSTLNASNLTFANWTDAVDTITLVGNTRDNTITGSSRADNIDGGAGADILSGGNGDDTLVGGAVGAGLTNQLSGDAGSDTASYAGTNVQVYADLNTNAGFLGAGVVLTDIFTSIENLIGGNGVDTLNGNGIANRLNGGAGAVDDYLFGNAGNDTLIGGGHAVGSFNQLFGGADIDTVDYSAETGRVFVDLRAPAGHIDNGSGFVLNDLMNSIENVLGGSGDDILVGTDADNNLLVGNGGTDLLFGFNGNDTLIGGSANVGQYNQLFGDPGNDTASYLGTTFGVYADLNVLAGWVKNSGGALILTDVYSQIENLTGSALADTLVGNTAANILNGGAGADILYANFDANAPSVHDAAVDMFAYANGSESTLGSGFDQIVNFTSSQDKLDFRALNINAGQVTLTNNGGSWSVYADTDGVAGIGNNDLAILVQNATFVMSDIIFV